MTLAVDLGRNATTKQKTVQEIMILIAPFKCLAGVFSGSRGPHFGLCLPLLAYFMYAKSQGSGETLFMCRFA